MRHARLVHVAPLALAARLTLLALLAACGPGEQPPAADTAEGGTDTAGTSDVVRFSDDVAPLFRDLCNDCHHPESAIGYDFTDPFDPETGIVGRENSFVPNGSDETLVVDPGNPENSFLITKVVEEDLDVHVDGKPMPYQPDYFTEEDLAAVEGWIASGANDDAFFASQVAPLFGTEITLRKASGRCTWCHYPGAPNGLNILDVFDPEEGLVGVASAGGGVRVVPGDPDASVLMERLRGEGPRPRMPLHVPRLTEAQVQVLWDWIALGARDD